MCASTPDVPTLPERQASRLPDQGAAPGTRDRRARLGPLLAALTRADGLGTPPSTARPTLG